MHFYHRSARSDYNIENKEIKIKNKLCILSFPGALSFVSCGKKIGNSNQNIIVNLGVFVPWWLNNPPSETETLPKFEPSPSIKFPKLNRKISRSTIIRNFKLCLC